MNLTDYRICDLVKRSTLKVDYKNIIKKKITLYANVLAFSSILSIIFTKSALSLNFILGVLSIVGLGGIIEMVVPNVLKIHANHKLKQVVTSLKETGIVTSKLKLQRAKVHSQVRKYSEPRGVVIEEEQVAVFNDCYGDLKALRQVRSKLIELKGKENIEGANYIYPDYAEVFVNKEEAKKLLLRIETQKQKL